MTAFLSFLNTFAIWFYIGGVVAVLFGIKMLLDARRAGRTTLFTLEQEQASDRAFRAVLVMLAASALIGGVAGINAFVTPAVPTQEADVTEPTPPLYTPPVILPTGTPQPTLTLIPVTEETGTTAGPTTAARPTTAPGTVPATRVPTRVAGGPTSVAPTPAAPTPTAAAPTEPPTAPSTAALAYLGPALNTPPNGDSIGANNIRFSWGVDEFGNLAVPEQLPPDQFYRVNVMYTSRSQNQPAAIVVCLHQNSVDKNTGLNVSETRSDALDSSYRWNVTIVQAPSEGACREGQGSPLSPPSATWTFRLP